MRLYHQRFNCVKLDIRDTGERTVFVVENTFGGPAAAESEEGRQQYVEDLGDRVVRHRQDIYDDEGLFTKQRDFYPGFLRFDRNRMNLGEIWTETLLRVSDPKDGSAPIEETVSYDYEVLNVNAPVNIDGRSFSCLQIKRTARSDGETKYYWYTEGVGKVQGLTGNEKMEQLIESSYF